MIEAFNRKAYHAEEAEGCQSFVASA